jgi:[citrate (pro-3S)-lyase] ligase
LDFSNAEIRTMPLSLASCRRQAEEFLAAFGLRLDTLEYYAGVFIDEKMVAGGGFDGNVIKCIAADESFRGEGLTNVLMTHLRQQLRELGRSHVFVFTKPENENIFRSLSFYPVGRAAKAVLLDSDKGGVRRFCERTRAFDGSAAAIVMNCNPFTLGHLRLVEHAAAECEALYVLVVEEDRSFFPFRDRLEMAEKACAHLKNVAVRPGGPYMISAATFPSYFIKEMSEISRTYAELDVDIFAHHVAPALGITARYAGEEPLDPLTALYNGVMSERLPPAGVQVRVIPRVCRGGEPISASRVRRLLSEGRAEECRSLLPESSFEHIRGMEAKI